MLQLIEIGYRGYGQLSVVRDIEFWGMTVALFEVLAIQDHNRCVFFFETPDFVQFELVVTVILFVSCYIFCVVYEKDWFLGFCRGSKIFWRTFKHHLGFIIIANLNNSWLDSCLIFNSLKIHLYYSVPFHCLVECVDVVGTCLDDGDACVVTAVGKDEVDARELVAVGVPSNSRPKMI